MTYNLNLIKSIVIFFLYSLEGQTAVAGNFQPYSHEHFENPINVLVHEYNQKQILVIAHPGHDDSRAYFLLENLLKKVGSDPTLKQIILERPRDNSELYKSLSTQPWSEVIPKFLFPNEKSKVFSLCEPEWAYSIVNFMPFVEALNRKRKTPILVKSIDSISSSAPLVDPVEVVKPILPTDCDLTGEQPLFAASGNREVQTALFFQNDIWKNLKSGEKIIVLYHYAHVTKNLVGCMPFQENNRNWYARMTPSDWMAHFLKLNPIAENRISTVLIDGEFQTDPTPGVLKFGERVGSRGLSTDWGIQTKFVKNSPEVGADMFLESSFLRNYHSGKIYGTSSMSQTYDGYIWIKSPSSRFKLKESSEYLPEFCSSKNL